MVAVGVTRTVGIIMIVNKATLDLIKHFESLHDGDLSAVGLQPKLCPAGIWTCGWGRALRNRKGEFLRGEKDRSLAYAMYPSMTDALAEQFLLEDTGFIAEDVSRLLTKPYTDNVLGAMTSLAYNIGTRAFSTSSVLKFYNSGDITRSADSFKLWNKSNGKVLKGLVLRREAEKNLFLKVE